MFLNLETSSYSFCSREADPDDEWDRGNSCRDWSVHGITLSDTDGPDSLAADFDVQVGDTVYVVYAVYSTGDTFGSDEAAYLEVLSFNKDHERAERNRGSAEAGWQQVYDHRRREKYTLTIEFDSGGKVERSCPWDGYFESLDYVRCEAYVVRKP